MILSLLQHALLIADSTIGDGTVRELVSYDLHRLGQFDDPRILWLILGGLIAIALCYVVWLYRRERQALPTALRWLLPGLRLIALAGVVLFFLGIEKRVDQQVETESQVAILVDTSQSMSVADEPGEEASKLARGEAVAQVLADSSLIEDLRREHEVSLAVFDEKTRSLVRWKRLSKENGEPVVDNAEETSDQSEGDSQPATAWIDELQPQGVETRLGDALKETLGQDRGGPLAGVIIISDGGQNVGVEPLSLGEADAPFHVPLFTIGVGSSEPRRNLRVQELSAPARLYPKDSATVSALIQGEGYAGRTVEVELFAREAGAQASANSRIGQQQIVFEEDRQEVQVQFQLEPAEIGRLILELQIVAPSDDQYQADNHREVEVEVADSQTRVMLIASGASRDYRFLRNQLRRDPHTTVDVWLQSAEPGISQDADHILDAFPQSKEELYEYDCIIAFDPSWSLLDAQQVALLEAWVAEEAGGLIVVAGPIHTASWVQSPEHGKIRALYPVEFQRRLTLLDDGLYGSKTPWPLLFSREGEESDYLWLSDTAAESRILWSEFPGVYGCYAVKGPKPGARVLAYYSDPDAGLSIDRPVYFAEQFYGGGRVFYMGSGELWRLRELDLSYFEVLYTQLIRHVSQGRLLRGSSLGQLLVQRDRYSVGDDVVVRAQLTTANREPLIAKQVTARVVDPRGEGQNLPMLADESRPGNFVGQFSVRHEGSYRIELPVPDVLDEHLVRRIQVAVPSLEFDKTRRNESLLAALAAQSNGKYYSSLSAAHEGRDGLPPVARQIESRAEQKTIRGTPDHAFTERLNHGLLAVICGALCLEWFLRRLMKLA